MRSSFLFKAIRLLLAGLGLLSGLPCRAYDAKSDSLLQVLDQTLARHHTFDQLRLTRLAGLTSELHASELDDNVRFRLALLIHDEYKVFKYDSAFAYAVQLTQLAQRLHSPDKRQLARLRMALTLRSAGLFKETFDTLQAIRVRELAPHNKADFYELASLSYAELVDFEQATQYQAIYLAKSLAYADSAAQCMKPGSYEWLNQRLFSAKQSGNLAAGLAAYAQLLRLPLTPHQLAINASGLAKLYEEHGQHQRAFQLMLQAAIGDLESATKEGIALFRISDYCYQQGDLQRAYYYITEARQAAAYFKARHRLVQISPITSRIDGQKIVIVEQQRQQAKRNLLIICLLAALVLGFAGIIYAQLRRLKRAGLLLSATNEELQANNRKLLQLNDKQQRLNAKLQELNQGLNEANHIKEEYIGYYFSNTSRYIDKLGTLQKKLTTLLASKQLAGAQQLVKDIDIKTERANLFKGFDTVFIHLFPNFVAEFNALFSEDDRIYLADEHLLTTELRIFALIRLGIHDSEQISRILGYSIHTVYAYKTRVKNRSFLPNEAFEARVLAIQAL